MKLAEFPEMSLNNTVKLMHQFRPSKPGYVTYEEFAGAVPEVDVDAAGKVRRQLRREKRRLREKLVCWLWSLVRP